MNGTKLLLAGALALAVGPALAGINPLAPGLPGQALLGDTADDWTMTDTKGYGAELVEGNGASAMCVECHSVNPSRYVIEPAELGDYSTTANTYVIARGASNADAGNWGSHTVTNALVGTVGVFGYSNSGGGFSGGFAGARNNGEYLKLTAWANNGVSKYGNGGSGVTAPDSWVATVDTIANADADMICESCHNVLRNTANPDGTGSGNANKLLLGLYDDNSNDSICVACHSGTGNETVSTGYAQFHANGNLMAFNGSSRKRHHVLTGDNFTNYGTAGYDSTMWAPKFSNKLTSGWCGTDAFAPSPSPAPTTYATSAVAEFRGECNVSGVGTRSSGSLLGDIVAVNATTILCVNCHRPHNAKSESGAFIFRSSVVADTFPGAAGTSGVAAGDLAYGIRRQADVGNWTATKIYGEYVPLCNGCHQGYGQ